MKKTILLSAAIILISISAVIARGNSSINVNHSFLQKHVYSKRPVVSPNGKYIAIAGDNKVKIWDNKGNILGCFIDPKPYINPPNEFKYWNPDRGIYAVAFLPDNKHVAVSVFKRTVHILNLSGEIVRTVRVPVQKMEKGSSGWSTITKIVWFPDSRRLITFEPEQYDLVIRDSNFRMLHRIDLRHKTYSISFPALKIHPSGKYFVMSQNPGTPSGNGWNSVLKLYDRNGRFIRDLETDRPGRIKTPDGKFKREFLCPDDFDFSPDGKYVVFINRYYRVSSRDPLGRKVKNRRDHSVRARIEKRIRRVNIFTGKQDECWVIDPDTDVLKDVFFSSNGKHYIGLGKEHIYNIAFDGTVKKIIDHEKKVYYRRNRKYEDHFTSSDHVFHKGTGKIIAYTNDPEKGLIIYNPDGEKETVIKTDSIVVKNLYVSHYGRYLSFEIERGKRSLLFDTGKNRITTEKSSVYFDNNNRIYKLSQTRSKERRSYLNSITFNGKTEIFNDREYKLYFLRPLPTGQFFYLKNGATLFTADGEAVKRYSKASIKQESPLHPRLKYYIYPNTGAKYKTVQIYNMNGRKIREWYVGAFFSFKYAISPDGSLIAAGHDKTGYVQLWNQKGKLIRRISNLHANSITGIALTKNNRYLVSSEKDGTVRVLDLKKKRKLKLSLYNNNNFIASDNSGRYDCSDKVKHRVGISVKGRLKDGTFTEGLAGKFFRGK